METSRSAQSGFYYLHPVMQQKLYDMRWTELRPIQTAVIRAFFEHDHDFIISADTAAGKTEAAFLPVLSQILRDRDAKSSSLQGLPLQGLRAVYVSPLRALINDQFERLEDLCERAEIPVFKWHSDVAPPRKKKFLTAPDGVLLITPESIESLFVNHSEHIARLFKNVSWLVLDELHAFMGTERGAHLKSLLSRIDRTKKPPMRLLALSATIGDFEAAKLWLRPRDSGSIDLLNAPDGGKEILYRLKGYPRDQGPEAPPGYVADLIRLFPSTSLIFVNSKRMLEHLAYTVQKVVDAHHLPNRYRVHHGSLSKDEREGTEDALKTKDGTVTFCSSTLELGIDVGNVERVGQFGAPWSVSALRQRLGRSGRKDGEPSALALFVVDKPEQTSVIEKIRPELLQAIAMSELLFERWCESPSVEQLHYSTLIQQCLSVVAEKGGISAGRLYETLVKEGAFGNVTKKAFEEVLRSLGGHDLLEQTRSGDLILGLAGERVVRRYDFYAAFAAPEEIDVICQGHKVGSIFLALDMIPEGLILLAGRRWKIKLIDMEKNAIIVEPAKGGKAPPFGGETGPEIHARVRRKMFELLAGQDIPRYLDSGAAKMLEDARKAAREAKLCDSPFLQRKRNLLWLTWSSTAIHRTLLALGLLAEMEPEDCQGVALEFKKTNRGEFTEAYGRFLNSPPTMGQIASKFELALKGQEKYDRYLPQNLLLESFEKRYLDMPGALKAIESAITASNGNRGGLFPQERYNNLLSKVYY